MKAKRKRRMSRRRRERTYIAVMVLLAITVSIGLTRSVMRDDNPDTGEQERVQVGTREVVNGERERLMIIQDRCMKQCRQGASDFGMTVSSRCRLVVPKAKETKPENKFAKYASS